MGVYSTMEPTFKRGCPAGCTSPLCVFNDDPAGELDILKRTSHYSAARALEILLDDTGWLVSTGSAGHSERVRPGDYHAAIDRIIVESKQAKRLGRRQDLGRYDERFANLYVSWCPTLLATDGAPRSLPGMPHLVCIEWRPPIGPVHSASGTGLPPTQSPPVSGQPIQTSGQPLSWPTKLIPSPNP